MSEDVFNATWNGKSERTFKKSKMICNTFFRFLNCVFCCAMVQFAQGQILDASVSNFGLNKDGRCHQDTGSILTSFSFDLTVNLFVETDTFSYFIINGDNRSMGNSLSLTGSKVNVSWAQAVAANVKSIAPYRIVFFNSYPNYPHGQEVNLTDVVYSSHFFNPNDLDPDCPTIICKGTSMDRTYVTNPQSQSPPIFIKDDLTLSNFSLTHQVEFYAGNSVTLSPGYDSGSLGIASSYGIENCITQSAPYQCWDLNLNGNMDISEDINNDGLINNGDCN